MTEIERRLREAMHAAVDGEPPPADLLQSVMRRHRRYLGRAAAVTVLAVAMVVVVPAALASRGISPRGTHPGASQSPSASSPAPTRSASPQPREPTMMRGLPMPRTPGMTLLLSGRQPAWFQSATGRAEPIAGLHRSRFAYILTRVDGGWVAQPSPKGPACMPTCPGPRLPAYFIADGSLAGYQVGVSHDVAAANVAGRLWLETYPRGTADVAAAAPSAQEVSTSGQPIGSPVRLPPGYLIQHGLGPGLLLSPVNQGPGPVIYKLWDPATRRVIRSFANVIATSGREIAWGICGGCAVHLLDLPTGRSFTVAVPVRAWAYDGSFSSDGQLLAIHLSAGVTPAGEATLARIAVIDIAHQRLRVLPGSSIGVDQPVSLIFGWQGTSHQLVAAVSRSRTAIQVASWHPAAAHLLVRTIQLPRGMTVVLGPYG
jgi:hypothetical protein